MGDVIASASRACMLLFLVAWIGPVSCYLGTGPNEAGDLGEDHGSGIDPIENPDEALEPELPDPDAVEISDASAEDITEAPEPEAPWEDWCPFGRGCMDGCCPDCENGGTMEIGGCWDTCDEYYSIEMDCAVICPDFTCAVSSWEWLDPGCTGMRDHGFCMESFGKNSFWYRGALAVRVIGDYPEPDCPSEDPCCQPRACEFGLEVGDDCGGLGFVPLDLTEVPELAWSCTATNCGAEGTPPEGTWVKVHVRWHPNQIEPPETFVLEELCEIL